MRKTDKKINKENLVFQTILPPNTGLPVILFEGEIFRKENLRVSQNLVFRLGCAVRFRFEAKRSENEAKNFSLQSEKMLFFACFASKRKTGNHMRNENERSEISKAKRCNR
jgi:hypothetical protein